MSQADAVRGPSSRLGAHRRSGSPPRPVPRAGRCPPGPAGRAMAAASLCAAARHPLSRPSPLAPCPPPVALGSRLASPGAAPRVPSLCPRRQRAHGTAAASRTGTQRPRHPLAFPSRGRRPPGPARRAGHRRGHHRGRPGGPHTLRHPQTTPGLCGPAPLGILAGAWASRSPAKVRRPVPRRRAQHPQVLQDRSWKAHGRRCQRDRPRRARGKPGHQGGVALARDRGGCLWAMAPEGSVTPEGHTTQGDAPRQGAGDQEVSAEPQPRCGATRAGGTRPSGLLVPRQRQAPDGDKEGGTNPRIAARSPGVSYWLRLCGYRLSRETEDHSDEDLKK
jgi:hypothetical protein